MTLRIGLRPAALRSSTRSLSGLPSGTPAVLPDLDYDYDALEPHISADIMRLHHAKHHRAYVANYNAALEKQHHAETAGDTCALINIQPQVRFNGGGHINHSIFWKNLCPTAHYLELDRGSKLFQAIADQFGSVENLQKALSTKAAGVQGSGWAWLGYSNELKRLVMATMANQDPLSTAGLVPLLGIDVWEHAYYLQYKNARPDYLKAIWNVINWKDVAARYEQAAATQA